MDHPAVLDAAVVGSPDQLRGEVSKLHVHLMANSHFRRRRHSIQLLS